MSGFAVDLTKFGDKALANVDTIVRKVALDLLRGVVVATPVRTGRARANWQTTIGTPAAGEISGPFSRSGQAAISDGQQALASVRGDVTIFLTNNVPYIERLEYGWSGQAPNGMVRQTVARFSYLVDQSASASMSSMPRSVE